MKMLYMQGKHWIILEDAPKYCEIDWDIISKIFKEELSPDNPKIKLRETSPQEIEMELGSFKPIRKQKAM